jgi:hypothetical protein
MNFKKNKKVKCSETTTTILIKGKIDMKIRNFSEVCELKMTRKGSILQTKNEEFYSPQLKKTFSFYLAIVSEGNEPKPNFKIHLVNNNPETLDTELEYFLVGKHDSESVANYRGLCPPQNSQGSEVTMSEAERFLVKKSLHIRCKFLVTKYDFCFENKEEEEEEETFQQSMEKMFANPKLTNFQIICDDGQTFDCHKTILASKSDFFDEMFSSDVNSSSITIKDVTPQTVKKMLQYVYTNKFILDGERDLAEMILVANKYKISELFDACQLVMSITSPMVLTLKTLTTLKSIRHI